MIIEGLLGKKVGMTQVFTKNGECIPVTVLEVTPNLVVQIKNTAKDGYEAVQIGFKPIKENKLRRLSKPLKGHFKDQVPQKFLAEFKLGEQGTEALKVGQLLDVSLFEKGQRVDISGTSKGRGFSGVIRRHGFGGGPGSHGHRFHRSTGSIGASATPSRVFKNKKMPGQYGNVKISVQNVEIVDIKKDINALLIKGAVPGANGGVVRIQKTTKV